MGSEFALIRMMNPVGETADGQMFVLAHGLEWQQIPWMVNPLDCDCEETMCVDCADSWAIDWEVQLPTIQHWITV